MFSNNFSLEIFRAVAGGRTTQPDQAALNISGRQNMTIHIMHRVTKVDKNNNSPSISTVTVKYKYKYLTCITKIILFIY